MSGMEPTVDTVAVQSFAAHWYYLLAGGGALLLLVTVIAPVVLCCCRHRWESTKTGGSPHQSVMYHNSQPLNHPNRFYNQNSSCNLSHNAKQNSPQPQSGPDLETTLVLGPDKEDRRDSSQC